MHLKRPVENGVRPGEPAEEAQRRVKHRARVAWGDQSSARFTALHAAAHFPPFSFQTASAIAAIAVTGSPSLALRRACVKLQGSRVRLCEVPLAPAHFAAEQAAARLRDGREGKVITV